MKILMIDKYYFIKGGAERYYFELKDVLEAKGHQVIPFSMQHENNFESVYEPFFVNKVEYALDSFAEKFLSLPRITGRMLYSFHAKKRLEQLILREQPDIAHLHMIDHQLSPSILHTLKKFNIPVIQTIHQYKLVCPNYRLYNPKTNEICEKCLDGHFYHPVVEKCHKASALAGSLIAFESYLHRLTRIYEDNIDIFHTPSHFMGEKLRAGGVGDGKVRHLFYTLKLDNYKPNFEFENYVVYLGRLAQEKGVLTLLKAMQQVKDTELVIIGDGPERKRLQDYALRQDLQHVQFVGSKGGEELRRLVQNCKFLIVPSEWYDNSPLVIYEAFAYGKPVIGSQLGGIPELIDDGKNGLIFQAGNVDELAEKISALASDSDLISAFGRQARSKAEGVFDPEYHYRQIHQWYTELLTSSTSGN
ncbi:MAG: glycosyltransferase family 4 protein [bacterium]